jgi:hypothetical protein
MNTVFEAAAMWGLSAPDFNMGKGTNRNVYPVLDMEITDPEVWWDILAYYQKIEVGGVAIHYQKMSPNYRWDCYDTKYKDLKKSQKAIITYVLKKKDNPWSMIPLEGLLKKFI